MVEISEEIYRQEMRRRRKPVEPGQPRRREKSDQWDKGLTEYTGSDMISHTSTRVHSTNDITRQNNGDEDKARSAGINMLMRRRRVERGLINHS